MVHEAMVLEYSGRHLALIELAASLKLLLYVSLIACLFAPWGMAPRERGAAGARRSASPPMSASSPSAASCSRLFETSIAKMRVFRVPEFLGVALMLGLLGDAAALRVARASDEPDRLRHRSSARRPAGADQLPRALPGSALRAAQCLRGACAWCSRPRSPGRRSSRMRRISTSPRRSLSCSRRSSFRSRCIGSSCGSASIARSRRWWASVRPCSPAWGSSPSPWW